MTAKSIIVWLLLMGLAIANGGFREAILVSRVGYAKAHLLSTAMLCILIAGTAWLTIPWLSPPDRHAALRVGTLWLVLTLLFEFGFGHFVVHKPWPELLADYNLLAGRVWIFVPITVWWAPVLAARGRGFF